MFHHQQPYDALLGVGHFMVGYGKTIILTFLSGATLTGFSATSETFLLRLSFSAPNAPVVTRTTENECRQLSRLAFHTRP